MRCKFCGKKSKTQDMCSKCDSELEEFKSLNIKIPTPHLKKLGLIKKEKGFKYIENVLYRLIEDYLLDFEFNNLNKIIRDRYGRIILFNKEIKEEKCQK